MNTATQPQPTIRLNNDVELPAIGFGVFQTPPEMTAEAVDAAIKTGYRLIDTAAAYLNERQVGEGVARNGIDRAELFLQTKLWISDYGRDRALRAFDLSCRKLGVDSVDLYLLHQPVPTHFDDTVAAYRAMEELLADGRVRAIGVCNFDEQLLTDLIARTDVVPAVNQVELHPFYVQPGLRAAHARLGITSQAWSPLGGVNRYRPADPNAVKNPLAHPVVIGLAEKYGKTPAQVVLRWHVEHGTSAVPKSTRPERITENIDVFDFALSADDVAAIDRLDTGIRGGPDPSAISPESFPLTIPDEAMR
jgi:diketogulonate reductase-like aldo/keto reductase